MIYFELVRKYQILGIPALLSIVILFKVASSFLSRRGDKICLEKCEYVRVFPPIVSRLYSLENIKKMARLSSRASLWILNQHNDNFY